MMCASGRGTPGHDEEATGAGAQSLSIRRPPSSYGTVPGMTPQAGCPPAAHRHPLNPVVRCLNRRLPDAVHIGPAINRERMLVPMLLKEDVVMRMIDFAPLSRATIGFDRLFDMLD